MVTRVIRDIKAEHARLVRTPVLPRRCFDIPVGLSHHPRVDAREGRGGEMRQPLPAELEGAVL